MGSLSVTHLLIVLAIVVVLFGTKKLRNIGSDLGATIREFRSASGENHEGDVQAVYRQVAAKPAAATEGAGRVSPDPLEAR